jgi:hypothetical protein
MANKSGGALDAAMRLNNTKQEPTLEEMQRVNNAEVERKQKDLKKLAERYRNEPLVEVMGAPMYQAYFGRMMLISLNGFPAYIPLDGGRYNIPESYACVFNARIRQVNEDIEMQRRRSNYRNNFEQFPGQLDLVHRV